MNPSFRKTLRQTMREKRRLMTAESAKAFSKKLTHHLWDVPFILDSEHIALYMANDHEIDPYDFLTECLRLGKKCYLPVLDKEQNDHLVFVRYSLTDKLNLNRHNILEPDITGNNLYSTNLLDVVLLPLVAFDDNGGRLGMGKGYYDRTFAFTKENTTHKPLLIGLAYEMQKTDRIELEAWDIPLHGVVTEAGFRSFVDYA